jgi:hypothetical protein
MRGRSLLLNRKRQLRVLHAVPDNRVIVYCQDPNHDFSLRDKLLEAVVVTSRLRWAGLEI